MRHGDPMTTPDPAQETPVTALHSWLTAHHDDLIDDVARLVRRETPSDDKASLDRGLDDLLAWLTWRLGTPESARRIDGGPHGDTVVHHYAGTGAPVLVLAHYDTVWPLGTLHERPFTVADGRMTGPGVFDMKAGLVQAVWALGALRAAGLPAPPVRLVLGGDEEIGSPASRPVIEAEADGACAALVFEAAAGGAVKTARKGVGLFQVEVCGVEAHAGLDPAAGASAVDELARAVIALHALTDLSAGTSVNAGVAHGGTRPNVIAGRASAELDVRVASETEARRVDAALAALRPHDPRASVTVHGGWNRPVMERLDGTARLYALARDVAAHLGVDLAECAVGGASDGNFAAALGLPVLDGLGAVGDGAHARHEYAETAALAERAALAAGVLNALATTGRTGTGAA